MLRQSRSAASLRATSLRFSLIVDVLSYNPHSQANYQFSHYIAEAANTFSNLVTVALAVYGAVQSVWAGLPPRYLVGYTVRLSSLLATLFIRLRLWKGFCVGWDRQLHLPRDSSVRSTAHGRTSYDICIKLLQPHSLRHRPRVQLARLKCAIPRSYIRSLQRVLYVVIVRALVCRRCTEVPTPGRVPSDCSCQRALTGVGVVPTGRTDQLKRGKSDPGRKEPVSRLVVCVPKSHELIRAVNKGQRVRKVK